ncbi:MAG: YfcE family phosphodiesterase [Chloroflexi bacterium]|nr:MAG: YfcE family phosphodiesterase [Chloroflexota bacterium]HDN80383.1 metallophosphoesterase [Chloroflexota bacterium]
MLIAVVSDIHDHLHNLNAFKPVFEKADAAIFCGDFCAPFSLAALARMVSGPIHVVFGNNDGDQWLLSKVAAGFEHVHLEGPFARLELADRRIFVVHYPEIAEDVAASARYDLVCYGHNHKAALSKLNGTLLLNPGEVMGRFGTSSVALYDTETHEATLYALKEGKPVAMR